MVWPLIEVQLFPHLKKEFGTANLTNLANEEEWDSRFFDSPNSQDSRCLTLRDSLGQTRGRCSMNVRLVSVKERRE